MSWDFFTFGGGHFWEDVFFYQKWRIQRNVESKTYRLLDNWDIRRCEGSFEECKKAFLHFIEVYELARQKGHMIIMIHGLGESKNVFKPLWRRATQDGYMAAAINYPSTQKRIETHARQFDVLLNNLEDVQKVSFVTVGSGGLILRTLFNMNSPWRKHLEIGRIVEINPCYHGSRLISFLSKSKLMRFILGPMSEELSQEKVKAIPIFPKTVEVGLILSNSPIERLAETLTGQKNIINSVQDELELSGGKEAIIVHNNKYNLLDNTQIKEATMRFLNQGKF